jgi:hypothetical protein
MHLPPNFLKGVFIVISKCVMKTHEVELTESFILEDESNIDGFIEALQEGKNYIKKKKEEQNNDKH